MKLTVIIRDDAPMVHCGDSPSYRSVSFDLTDEQKKQIKLKATHGMGKEVFYEQVSQVILEPKSS